MNPLSVLFCSMSFNFDFQYLASCDGQWNGFSGTDTPPLTPLYSQQDYGYNYNDFITQQPYFNQISTEIPHTSPLVHNDKFNSTHLQLPLVTEQQIISSPLLLPPITNTLVPEELITSVSSHLSSVPVFQVTSDSLNQQHVLGILQHDLTPPESPYLDNYLKTQQSTPEHTPPCYNVYGRGPLTPGPTPPGPTPPGPTPPGPTPPGPTPPGPTPPGPTPPGPTPPGPTPPGPTPPGPTPPGPTPPGPTPPGPTPPGPTPPGPTPPGPTPPGPTPPGPTPPGPLPYTPLLESDVKKERRYSPYRVPNRSSSQRGRTVRCLQQNNESILLNNVFVTSPQHNTESSRTGGAHPPICLLEQAARVLSEDIPQEILKPLVRSRKKRSELTDTQRAQLELVYTVYKYLGHDVRKKVAEEVGLPQKTVMYWFQNRRAREKKAGKDIKI